MSENMDLPGTSTHDLMLRAVQALEGIQDQLSRIRVAEGPCGATTEEKRTEYMRSLDGTRHEQTWTQMYECNLPDGHGGMHCTDGPFRDTGYQYDYHRWEQE